METRGGVNHETKTIEIPNSNYLTSKNIKSLVSHIFPQSKTETSSNVTDYLHLSREEVRMNSNSNYLTKTEIHEKWHEQVHVLIYVPPQSGTKKVETDSTPTLKPPRRQSWAEASPAEATVAGDRPSPAPNPNPLRWVRALRPALPSSFPFPRPFS